jgi:hypothetical protein
LGLNETVPPPDEPIPFDALQARMLPIADFVMGAMLSRPGGLSVGDTRVTPVTIGLAFGTAIAAVALAVITGGWALDGHGAWWALVALLLVALALATAVLGVYGTRQRLMIISARRR